MPASKQAIAEGRATSSECSQRRHGKCERTYCACRCHKVKVREPVVTSGWQITTSLTYNSDSAQSFSYGYQCKLCAISFAMIVAEIRAASNDVSLKVVTWKVERQDSVTGEWKDAYNSDDRIGDWVKNHGH